MADPAKLDRYRSVRILGAGGMGTVSLAQDTVLGRQVALKRVTGTAGGTEMLRLRREALVGASVSHRNLVSIYDVEENDEGELVIVMEYVEGETVRDAVAREGGLPSAEALRILEGAAAGLDAIHAQGIVHRDVKPANVLLGHDGSVKVADLGIAAVADRTRITSAGDVLGSLSYMAPEQLHDTAATPAIDIYALGAVAYEVLSGQRARREANPVALAYAIDNKPPPDLREAWPQAPVAAADLLERTMARDPERRPRSAGECVSRLRAALDPASTAEAAPVTRRALARTVPPPRTREPARTVPPPRPREPRPAPRQPVREGTARRSRWVPAAGLGLVGLAAIAVLIATSGSGGAPPRPKTASHHASKSAPLASRSTSASSTTSASTGASSSSPAAPASAPAPSGSPGAAATSFYTLAAAHRYPQAWTLADPSFRAQLHGYQGFQNTFANDRSITVNSLHTVNQSGSAATVAMTTTSVQSTGTQHCSGTVQLSGGSGAPWRVHQIQIGCR
ncbi:MAG: serine/threonine-protein kinase [Solirubrobacteraceae bacterium]